LTRGEQRGEVDRSELWHGAQDHHVALLAVLPGWFSSGGTSWSQSWSSRRCAALSCWLTKLMRAAIDNGCCFKMRDLGGLPAANAVRLEDPLDRALA
jgi:hypothetical protein